MNRLFTSKRGVVLLVEGAIILVIAIGLLINYEHKKSALYTTKIVDRDTGQVLYIQPNQKPETNAAEGQFVFGASIIIKDGATQAQFQKVQQAFTQYAKTNLHNQYLTLTVIPRGFTARLGIMSGKLRLGETDKTVDLTVKLSQLKYVEVIIKDPSGSNGGNYDSGRLTVDPNFYNSSQQQSD